MTIRRSRIILDGNMFIHWGSVWIQDFNFGKAALISKNDRANAFVVKDDIWSCYVNTGDPNKQETRAPWIYGAPLAAKTSVPDNGNYEDSKVRTIFYHLW